MCVCVCVCMHVSLNLKLLAEELGKCVMGITSI